MDYDIDIAQDLSATEFIQSDQPAPSDDKPTETEATEDTVTSAKPRSPKKDEKKKKPKKPKDVCIAIRFKSYNDE